jgi:hypothetical protein
MDQRSPTAASLRLQRPVHRACVVRGCWCGSTTAAEARSSGRESRASALRRRLTEASPVNLTAVALRSVGLPVA